MPTRRVPSEEQEVNVSQPAVQPILSDEYDFSLVLGGPLFQLFRKSHLSGAGLELLSRRVIFITALAWLPLLILSVPSTLRGVVQPFFRDIETHVRFLVALPALILAESIVHSRIRPAVQAFIKRNIIPPEELQRFKTALQSAMRLRDSVPLELGLLVLVYTVGQVVWWNQITVSGSSWFASPVGGRMNLTPAGYWNVFVSIPIFQFILLRWYFRLLIWFRFLWQVSRLKLHLIATHPDRAGGLSFLGRSSYAFAPVLFAQGAILSGIIASRIIYGGEHLMAYKAQAIGFVAFFMVAILGPLMVFTPQLMEAKRKGLAEYGLLANDYVAEFEKKWVTEAACHREELLGNADFQSLADMGNSYDVVREMRPVPFGVMDMTRLAYATAVPLVPLGLTVFSFEELVTQVLKVVF
jgi:hypothetical protein